MIPTIFTAPHASPVENDCTGDLPFEGCLASRVQERT
jgi:hypothetical protein